MTIPAHSLKRLALGLVFAAITLTDAAAQAGGNSFFRSWYRDPTINAGAMPRPQWGTVATTPVPATRSRSADTASRSAPVPARPIAAPAPAAPPFGSPLDITRPHTAPNFPQATTQAAAPAAADPSADRQYVDGIYLLNTDYWLGYPKHAYKLVTAPARFDNTKDWMVTGGLLAGAGLLVALDEDIQSFWQDNIAGGAGGDFVGAFEPLGRTWYAVAGGAGVYVAAEAAEQLGGWNLKREKAAGLLTVESVLISQAITSGIKELSGRSRPNASDDAFLFEGPGNGNSFPSGHATVAFAVATTISNVYGEDYAWVPWIAYPVATATALARIEDNKHWASDVFVGGLIGYAVAKTVTLYNPFLKENNLAIRPLRDGLAQGAALVVGF